MLSSKPESIVKSQLIFKRLAYIRDVKIFRNIYRSSTVRFEKTEPVEIGYSKGFQGSYGISIPSKNYKIVLQIFSAMNYNALLQRISDHVYAFYETHSQPALLYHNMPHTVDVVTAAKSIAAHYDLDDRNFFIVLLLPGFMIPAILPTVPNVMKKKAPRLLKNI